MQTDIWFWDQERYKRMEEELKAVTKKEVKQVREKMAAMEEQHKAELKWGRERRNKMAERLRAQNDEIRELKQRLQKRLTRKLIKK